MSQETHLIPKFKNNMTAVLPSVAERYSKDELEDIIVKNLGIVTVICSILDCTYKQFYNALDKYDLRDALSESKKQLVSIAEKAVLDCLNSESEKIKLEAAKHTLNSLGRDSGWGNNQTVINQQINLSEKSAEIKNIFGLE